MLKEEDWVHCTVSVDGASCTLSYDAIGPCATFEDILESVIRPALLGAGYHPDIVKNLTWGE